MATLTEAAIFDAYRNTDVLHAEPLRVEQCACGGFLTAPRQDSERIRLEVVRHQATPKHQVWWAERS